MANENLTLSLNFLYCYFVEEEGFDDVYLKFRKKKIWPPKKKFKKIMMDTTTELEVAIPAIQEGQEITIELWDHDWLSRNDLLGAFHFVVEGVGGPFTTDMTLNKRETDKAKYTLEWEVY